MLFLLFALFVILTFVTLIGHLIWVVLAAIFTSFDTKSVRRCVFCGRANSRHGKRCEWCSKDLESPLASELADIEAFRRQLDRFAAGGAVERHLADALLAQCKEYRQELLAPSRKRPVQTAPEAIVVAEVIGEVESTPPPVLNEPIAMPSERMVEKETVVASLPTVGTKLEENKQEAEEDVCEEVKEKIFAKPQAARPAPYIPKPAKKREAVAPSRSWTEVLSAFMEQRNIRWGELIGGLLFVCSSVALVVSLWDTIERIPYSKFFIFVSVSSAVFGVGLYAHHRWKLESTSRALLVIATLLVPLNFVAMAVMASAVVADQSTIVTLASEAVSLAIFAYLIGQAASVLVPVGRWLTVFVVLGNSITILLAARVLRADASLSLMYSAGALPVALFTGAIGFFLHERLNRAANAPTTPGSWHPLRLTEPQIGWLLTLLGLTLFPTIVALGLVTAQVIKPIDATQAIARGHVALVLERLSTLVAITALPILASGLTVVRGCGRDKELAAYRLTGTVIALVAMIVMLTALGLAWPSPRWLIAVAMLDAMALIYAAFRWRLPVLHSGAIACLAVAYLTSFYLLIGDLSPTVADPYGFELMQLMISAKSGTAAGGLFIVLAIASELLALRGYRRHSVIYFGGCCCVAAIGLFLVTVHGSLTGGLDALRAAILYAVYGVGSLALTARWRRLGLAYLGLILVASSALWGLWWRSDVLRITPLWGAVLAIEAFAMATIAAYLKRRTDGKEYDPWLMIEIGEERAALFIPRSIGISLVDLYRFPLMHVGEATAIIALAITVYTDFRDQAMIVSLPTPVVASLGIAAAFFLLAWLYRSPIRTWAASLVTLAGALHALNFNYFGHLPYIGPNWTIALLAHASLALAAVLYFDRLRAGGRAGFEFVHKAIAVPLADSALLSSGLAVPTLVFGRSGGSLWLACCFPWLAAVWLVLARRKRSVELFAAHQLALAFASLAAVTVWLKQVGWIVPRLAISDTPNLLERIAGVSHAVLIPRNLQAYGIALGLYCSAWAVIRIVDLRRKRFRTDSLLQNPISVDWCIRHAIVALQWVLIALAVMAEVPRELLRGAPSLMPAGMPSTFGPTAWICLIVLTLMLLVTLWERWRRAELVAVLLLAASLPCLLAGQFTAVVAVASAVRWTLAIDFAVCSIAAYNRNRLAAACRRVHAGPFALAGQMPEGSDARLARGILIAIMALPVLAITILAAMLQIAGEAPGGPVAKSFFDNLGPTLSYLPPLAVLIAALVGYAIREHSSGYAFSAGLVLEMAVVLGYALRTSLAKAPFDAVFGATLFQLFAITAAAWAIVWLIARKKLDVWRETSRRAKVLMNLQIGMSILAKVVVLGLALFILVFALLANQSWSVTAGQPLGWIALVLPLAASQLRSRLRPHAVGLAGLAVLGLLACTIRSLSPVLHNIDPAWGYRTLMLGWSIYALLVVAAMWWVASLRTTIDSAGPPQGLVRMAAVWVRVAGILGVLLGLKAAFLYEQEQLWAATAIAVASAAGATKAVWRRREGWAFAAALGVNVAASIVVWHFELARQAIFEDYWLRLVQANVIASAAVAIVWLAARKRLYELRDMTLGESPLLGVQVLLPVVGNIVLLVIPVGWLIHTPNALPQWMDGLAAAPGWAGLLLTTVAFAWYVRQTQISSLIHVLGGFLLGAGVLAACNAGPIVLHSRWAPKLGTTWIAYHSLTTAWAAAGLLFFGLAIGRRRPLDGNSSQANAQSNASLIQSWVDSICTLTVVMATLHAFHDPARPWWAAGAILTVSFTVGLFAMIVRKPGHVYFSALLINLAGTIVWWAYSPSSTHFPVWNTVDWMRLVQANVLCLALGSLVWSLLEYMPRGVPHFSVGRQRPCSHEFAQLAAVLLGLVTAIDVVTTLGEFEQFPIERLDWIALGGVLLATAVCLRDHQAQFTLPTLYSLGLSAVVMGLLARTLPPRMFCWSAVNELAAYALLVAVIAYVLRVPRADGTRGVPDTNNWFPFAQSALVAVAGTLAMWVTLVFNFDGFHYIHIQHFLIGRMASELGLFLILLTTFVMAAVCRDRWRALWQFATIKTCVVFLTGLGWALITFDCPAPWLHRTAVVMISSTFIILLAGFPLMRILPSGSDWCARTWQSLPSLAGVALATLVAMLLQEVSLFAWPEGAPLVHVMNGMSLAAIAGLIAGSIAFAVTSGDDPLQLSERGRQAYVYAAELLAAAIGLQLYLTMPWLLNDYVAKYWMLIVMAVAFLGAGLSEWFHRRRRAVLSVPLANTALFLPLLPAIGFWIAPSIDINGPWHLVGRSPAVWFLMALFYGVLAITRRSWKCGSLAVLSANLGLWVGLALSNFDFLQNPQLFIIPIALAGLVAEYLNHDRLSEAQSTAFRYLTLSAIYISSTADMFIAGLGHSWLLPLVLMLLSVTGMLAGMSLRVRSFLFLGFTFLVLDALSMIWHAAYDLNHTWIWYVCGIALGAAILAMFAVFEKRRNDVLLVVEQLHGWAK
jgi:hypothetical protein